MRQGDKSKRGLKWVVYLFWDGKCLWRDFRQTSPCPKQATNEQITHKHVALCVWRKLRTTMSAERRSNTSVYWGWRDNSRKAEDIESWEEKKTWPWSKTGKTIWATEPRLFCPRATKVSGYCPKSFTPLLRYGWPGGGQKTMSSLCNWFLVLISLCLTQIGWFY